jgi:hypothetical protein
MTSELKVFPLTKRLFLMYQRKGLLYCYNPRCLRGALKIGETVVSRMVSSGYGWRFRIGEKCQKKAELDEVQRTRRVLYHIECAEELNLV